MLSIYFNIFVIMCTILGGNLTVLFVNYLIVHLVSGHAVSALSLVIGLLYFTLFYLLNMPLI